VFDVGDAVRFIGNVDDDIYVVVHIRFHNTTPVGYDVKSLTGTVYLAVPEDDLELAPNQDLIAEENYKRAMQGV